MIEYELLGGERPHAVPQQNERRFVMFLLGNRRQPPHILDKQLKTPGPKSPKLFVASAVRAAASAVIVPIKQLGPLAQDAQSG
jgi:hypothetical protein